MPGFLLKLAQGKESRSRFPATSERIPKVQEGKPYRAQKFSNMIQDGEGGPITVSFEYSMKSKKETTSNLYLLKKH